MRGHCKKQREWEEILAGYPSTALVAATSQLSHKTSFSCNFVSTPAPVFWVDLNPLKKKATSF